MRSRSPHAERSPLRRFGVVAVGAAGACMVIGAAIVAIQSFWITYGVFVRYVLKRPDEMVTEATALLLLPLAFVGLPWALREDAFPRVTFLVDKFPPRVAKWVQKANLVVMIGVGLFYFAVTLSAAIATFRSGASSSVLGWPEFAFWTPVAAACLAFVVLGIHELIAGGSQRHHAEPDI